MKNTACSGAALVDEFTGGLFGSLLKKIFGPNGPLWLRRLKKFDRREDPFVRAQEVGEVSQIDPSQGVDGLLRNLQSLGVDPGPTAREDILSSLREVAARRFFGGSSRSPHRFFSVRLGDLMSLDKIRQCTYQDVLAALGEEGFVPCDYWSGILALDMVALHYASLKADYQAQPAVISYTLIADPFCVGEDEKLPSGRLVQLNVWLTRERDGSDSRGSWAHLTPHAIDHSLFNAGNDRMIDLSPHHPFRDAESRLLCLASAD